MAFWKHYNAKKLLALGGLNDSCNIEGLADVADLLRIYCTFMNGLNWNEEKKKLQEETCKLVREQIGIIVNKQENYKTLPNTDILCHRCKITQLATVQALAQEWEKLSHYDWNVIFRSILLVASRKDFVDCFALEMLILGQLNDKFASFWKDDVCHCNLCQPTNCQYYTYLYYFCSKCSTQFLRPCEKATKATMAWNVKYSDGKFNVVAPTGIMDIPSSLSDKKHWGHLAWTCCALLETLRNGK